MSMGVHLVSEEKNVEPLPLKPGDSSFIHANSKKERDGNILMFSAYDC